MISAASLGSVPTLVNRLIKRVAAADLERLGLGAGEQLVEIVVVVGRVVGRFVDHGGVRRGGERRARLRDDRRR